MRHECYWAFVFLDKTRGNRNGREREMEFQKRFCLARCHIILPRTPMWATPGCLWTHHPSSSWTSADQCCRAKRHRTGIPGLSQLCHLLALRGGAEFNAEFTLDKEELENDTHTHTHPTHQGPPGLGRAQQWLLVHLLSRIQMH